jgi:exodeoxyribonuclease V alpha subunit
MDCVEGTVENIIYRNESNGYTVCDIACDETLVTAVGYMPFLNEGEAVRVSGTWTCHPEYGEQFKVESYEKVMPRTVETIEKYLASGVIKGIGPATAKKIVEKFGEDSLDVIQYNPEKLTEIKGIGAAKACEIGAQFEEQRELMNVVLFLQRYGINPSYAMRIYRVFGKATIDTIKTNPYRLSDEVFGIGFKTADRIAMNLGIDPSSIYRICSGLRYILTRAAGDGHTYLPWDALREYAAEMLGVGLDSLEDALVSLQLDKAVIVDRTDNGVKVYLAPFYTAEVNVCRKLGKLIETGYENLAEGADIALEQIEQGENIKLAELQKEAVKEALSNGVLVITGGPGTGKTTIIKTIIKVLTEMKKKVLLAAPTGRAAKRMQEATGYEAKTIHRLLEITYLGENEEQVFQRNEDNPLEADAVIIDEMSMVDILLFNNLLKAVKPGTRLIMVGDMDQLPSVGPGNVLKDIIAGGCVKTVRLTEIFRQAEESKIIVNAHMINKGEIPEISNRDKDFFIIRKAGGTAILDTILDLCHRRLSESFGYDPIRHIQVLTPMKKGITGVTNLNIELQKVINPKAPGKQEKAMGGFTYRTGDRVMQIRNNYRLRWERYTNRGVEDGEGVFNGDTGIITEINDDFRMIKVRFDDDRYVEYDYASFDEIEPAFALTIHKSQGSEFPVVIVPLYPGPPVLMTRNLLYTAVTRAKDMVILVGDENVFRRMIENEREVTRYTGLADRLGREWLIRTGES